ncbi:tyrosinase family protein [Nocardioides sp. GXQ0305]|uniref:tyrosinase family protein n=1 Tax=Nocardioides sp. GXQ0305 TaxID=3423912 RepID=UPI003D7E5A23
MVGETTALSGLKRRGFLAGAGAVAAGLGTTHDAHAATAQLAGPLVRRDVWSLSAPWNAYTEAYARAVRLMQQRDPRDPTSWAFQAAIHGTFSSPEDPTWNQCQHQSWHFFPWHRVYLYYFERIVRAAVAQIGGPSDWALPYWNWDRPFPSNTLPQAFRVPQLPDGSENPLYLPLRRTDAMMAGFQFTTRQTSTVKAMRTTQFATPDGRRSFGGGMQPVAQFAGALGAMEKQPHNVIHVQIGSRARPNCTGGWMGVIKCAANDPVFFLHHANVDRLWDVWLAQGGGRANPTDTAWLNQPFTMYDENGQPVTLRSRDVVDTAGQLGVVYG